MAAPATKEEQKAFLDKIVPAAQADWEKNHLIIPSLTIAQGIIESAWGKSELAVKANNLFGIKANKDWKGDVYNIVTTEYYDNKTATKVVAAFRKYSNYLESVADHTVFLSKARYKNIHGVLDFVTVAKNIKADGYATSPTYAQTLIDTYNKYNLVQYDIGTASTSTSDVKPDTPAPSSKVIYTVQTGAYRMKANAEAMKSKLVYKGYKDAFIVYTAVDKLYRVQLGAFSIKDNAIKLQKELKSKGIESMIKQKG